jgi:hypothetical protein
MDPRFFDKIAEKLNGALMRRWWTVEGGCPLEGDRRGGESEAAVGVSEVNGYLKQKEEAKAKETNVGFKSSGRHDDHVYQGTQAAITRALRSTGPCDRRGRERQLRRAFLVGQRGPSSACPAIGLMIVDTRPRYIRGAKFCRQRYHGYGRRQLLGCQQQGFHHRLLR